MTSAQSERPLIYRFGEFEVNPYTRQLLRAGRSVPIQPKPLDLLLYLIRQRARVVPRDEILAEVWQGVRVEAQALGFALHAVRRAVGDDGNRQSVIRTVSRSGLQFVSRVEELAAPLDPSGRMPRGVPFAERAFLGRERLMADVEALLDDAERRSGRVLLLSGEAGIGKTRALERIAEAADARGLRVFRSSCVEGEGAPAFWPWVQILRAAVDRDPPPALLRALGEGAREVAWMVPELRRYVPELASPPSLDPRAARFLLFESVGTFLEALASEAPHLLCIDDLHRADPASLALLLHVAREIGRPEGQRLLLVGTYRDAELRAAAELAPAVAAIAALPHGRHHALAGLEIDHVRALVFGVSGRTASDAAAFELQRKTNGNPFFLRQILRVLESEERLAELESTHRLELTLPPQVQDTIRQQLRRLTEPVTGLLELAAVIGREFDLTDVEAASGLPREELLAMLDEAIAARIVEHAGEEIGAYRFVHSLVRDSIYSGLALEARSRHHGAIARALAARTAQQPGPESAALAHHHAHSSVPGDAEKAVLFYEQAAAWASERGAFEDAPKMLETALSLLREDPHGSGARRCQLLLKFGDALVDVGDLDGARNALHAAAKIARRSDLYTELAQAALSYSPDVLAIETGVYDSALVRLLEEAIERLGTRADSLKARLLARLALAHQWNNENQTAGSSICAQAREVASRVDPGVQEYVDTAESVVNFSMVHPEKLFIASVSKTSVPLAILQRILRVTSRLILGQVADADVEIERLAELVTHSRHPRGRWYVALMRATRAQMSGRHEEASELANQYLALGSKYGDRNAVHSYMTQMIMGSFDTGENVPEERQVRSMVSAFPGMVGWRAGLTLYLTELGRLEEAKREFLQAVRCGALERARPNEWYGTIAALALTTGVLGETETAGHLYEILAPCADQLTVVGYSSYCLGSTQRLLGVLASALRQWETSETHFLAALSANDGVGASACNGRVYLDYARMLRTSGRTDDAWNVGSKAVRIAQEFGFTRLEAIAAREREGESATS